MKKRVNNCVVKRLFLVLAVLLFAFGMVPAAQAAAADAETAAGTSAGTEGKKLVITVVEDIPAQDIEEAEVPLAGPVAGGATSSVLNYLSHIMIVPVAAAILIILRVRYIRKGKQLRAYIDGYSAESDFANSK